MAAKTNSERQKKYREKQKVSGKKQISVRLKPHIRAILDQERANTGESILKIITRLIEGLEKAPGKAVVVSKAGMNIHAKAIELRDTKGFSWGQMAIWFNNSGVPHPTEEHQWFWQTAKMIYKQAVKKAKTAS